jgi:hypothetical protein
MNIKFKKYDKQVATIYFEKSNKTLFHDIVIADNIKNNQNRLLDFYIKTLHNIETSYKSYFNNNMQFLESQKVTKILKDFILNNK